MWFEWIPAVARRGATCKGMGHWAAFKTNNSLQTKRSNATWSVTARSGKNGIFRAHSTALNSNLAASSQIFSMPMIPHGMFRPCWNLVVGYGSARKRRAINPERYEWPLDPSPFTPGWFVFACGTTCVGGIRPRCTAVEPKGERVHSTNNQFHVDTRTDTLGLQTNIQAPASAERFWRGNSLTFTSHSNLETLFQTTVLALVSMVLVNGTVPRSTTCVGQVAADTTLEERLAPFTCENPVVFPRRLVPTNSTLDLSIFLRRVLLAFRVFPPRRGCN